MRALSVRQAARCETAFFDKCHCRCGGKFHGARRVLEADRERFEALPEDDPHHVRPKAEKKPRAGIVREWAKQLAQRHLWEEEA
jgi:hypothetical protein